MGHNRIRRFFENIYCFAETAIPSRASGEEAASAQAAGKPQSVVSQRRQPAESFDGLPCGTVSDAARPPARGWCNYSI